MAERRTVDAVVEGSNPFTHPKIVSYGVETIIP